jgi:predicted nucleic acid-binding protein
MIFWDSSAILSIIASQSAKTDLMTLFENDPSIVLWWGTCVELSSGLCRLRREDVIDDTALSELLKVTQQIACDADEIEPSEKLRQTSIRILRVHNLRAADSLQLAAALIWTDSRPNGSRFVCLDKRLREAAEKEGFEILPK